MKKMNNEFKGYDYYKENEFDNIIRNALISVDANILLHFFRYSNSSSRELTNIFKKLKSRLFISYYAAKEYYSNKDNVIRENINEYDSSICSFEKQFNELKKVLESLSKNKYSNKKEIKDIIEKNENDILKLLKKEKKEKIEIFKSHKIENDILNIFNDVMLDDFSEEEMKIIKDEGKRRVKENIPPGYKDSQKEENGDYYIFKSLINYSKIEKKDLIFITDDTKEDWFSDIHGVKSARAELLNEFYKETGNLILILSLEDFIKLYYEKIEKVDIDKQLIDEIRHFKETKPSRKKYHNDNHYLLNILMENIDKEYVIRNKEKLIGVVNRLRMLNSSDYKTDRLYKMLISSLGNDSYENYCDILSKIIYYNDYKMNNIYDENLENKKNIIVELNKCISSLDNNYNNEDAMYLNSLIKKYEIISDFNHDNQFFEIKNKYNQFINSHGKNEMIRDNTEKVSE